MVDAYEESDIIQTLRKRKTSGRPLKIAFLDIDSTMTGSIQTTNATRKRLERLNYSIVYVTTRTEEMLLSSHVYEASRLHGFDRPEPHLGRYNGRYVSIAPELVEPEGILNPHIIAGSTGTQIIVRAQNSYYKLDASYEERFGTNPENWRKEITNVVNAFNKEKYRAYFAMYENSEHYDEGKVDIYPPKYRIVLFFQSARYKQAFRQFIKHWEMTNNLKINLSIIDDSYPQKEKYILRLTPKRASKRKAVDHIITKICEKLIVDRHELEVLLAGDSLQDLEMGLMGAKGTKARFLLVGGSRIAHALQCKEPHEELFDEKFCQMRSCLNALKKKGHYSFQELESYQAGKAERNNSLAFKLSHSQPSFVRQVILCDEACAGKKAAESILSMLED